MARRFHYGPLVAVAALIGLGVAIWYYMPRPAAPAPVATSAPATTPPPAIAPPEPGLPPEPAFPVDQVLVPAFDDGPLPTLADSDGNFLAALSPLLDGATGQWLVQEFVIQKLVTTIDNLPGKTVTQQVYAGRPVAGSLAVAEADGRLWLDESNFARYDAGMALFERVDLRQAVAIYVHYYPLFQQAYRELGGPDRQFNDRLVEVLDHLLAAPEATGPLKLQRPAKGGPRLEFADPQRQAASVGHKAMWRLGPAHAERMKARLRELRTLLAGQRPAA